MKTKLFLLLLATPILLFSQTVHVNDKKIEYKGDVKVPGLTQQQVFDAAVQAVKKLCNENDNAGNEKKDFEYTTHGSIRLTTPYPIIRKVQFRLSIAAGDEKYAYKIDKVSLWEKHRGKDVKEMSSKDLIDQLDESGNPSIEAEHILNAIDLNIQKLLTLLEQNMRKNATTNQQGR